MMRPKPLKRVIRYYRSRVAYVRDKREYIRLSRGQNRFIYFKENSIPVYSDRYKQAGSVDIHYYLQDIYMARKVLEDGAQCIFDIGSRVDGFISHLIAAGVNVTMLDIRPLDVDIKGLSFVQTDATKLDGIPDGGIKYLSSLHAIEHFGLGRYGDRIDPNGWKDALEAMSHKLSEGGKLYLSVPIGINERLCFNAHRIFSPYTIGEALDNLYLESFSYIHDYRVIESDFDFFMKNGGDYDCGMFVFEKSK